MKSFRFVGLWVLGFVLCCFYAFHEVENHRNTALQQENKELSHKIANLQKRQLEFSRFSDDRLRTMQNTLRKELPEQTEEINKAYIYASSQEFSFSADTETK